MKNLQRLHNVLQQISHSRCLSSLQNIKTQTNEEAVCTQAVREAEKVVGYPTSFLNLRWLLNDEIANVAMHIKKLVGTNHPLLNTARDLLLNRDLPAWGLIVLLVSKAGGLNSSFSELECDITAGILHSQRVLAEVTEIIRTSNLIHNSVLNIDNASEDCSDLNFGNKIALLSGDYLLSISFRELAGIRNQEVNEIISTSLRDLSEAHFIGPLDSQNRPLPAKPLLIQEDVDIPNQFDNSPLQLERVLGNTKAEWILRHYLGGASLLAKCCQGSLRLAGHPESFQHDGYLLGRNMGLAWQARMEQQLFRDGLTGPFSLISAPVMFHLQQDPSFYGEIIKGVEDVNNVDFNKIRKIVRLGPGLSETRKLQEELCENASNVLDKFPKSDAKNALSKMLSAI